MKQIWEWYKHFGWKCSQQNVGKYTIPDHDILAQHHLFISHFKGFFSRFGSILLIRLYCCSHDILCLFIVFCPSLRHITFVYCLFISQKKPLYNVSVHWFPKCIIFYSSANYMDCAVLILDFSYIGDRKVNDYLE